MLTSSVASESEIIGFAKKELEADIVRAIQVFENKTGITVSNIELFRTEVSYQSHDKSILCGIAIDGII